jgi:Matrixin
MRTAALLGACALALLVCGAPTASAATPVEAHASYRVKGDPWPGGRVSYYVAARQHRRGIARAVRAWNTSGARVRFTRVPRARAKLIIRYAPQPPADEILYGVASVGHSPFGNTVFLPRLKRYDRYHEHTAALVAAHELGHVLGLDHENRRCALMNPTGTGMAPGRCEKPVPWQRRCRLVEPDDVRGAVSRYGGRPRKPGPAFCDLYPAPPPPAGLTARHEPADGLVYVNWAPLPTRHAPVWLTSRHAFPPGVEVEFALTPDTCASAPAPPDLPYDETPTGLVLEGVTAGTWCLAVWTRDELGRLSETPATTPLTV